MAQDEEAGFKVIQLRKIRFLGLDLVEKCAKLNMMASSVLLSCLFDQNLQHRLPMRRFEKECEFLSTIRHPNIIQYLGMYQDPDTHLPVLLMELMDNSLTHFLEGSPQPIPYHIQVNVSHDISLALAFLHSNGIIHRNLSSNNVLMIGDVRAKVTDFGMARLGILNPQLTLTLCPGSDVYMPPEAVKNKPLYTEKIDCFSFGVIAVQIMTRLFPQPGDRQKDTGILARKITERERRQNHISKIDSSHPLLAITFNCLKDKDVERPSALQICKFLATLKTNSDYSESVRLADDVVRQEHNIQRLREQQEEEIQQLEREKAREIEVLKRQLEEVKIKKAKAQERVKELKSQLWK